MFCVSCMSDTYKCSGVAVQRCSVIFFMVV